MVRRFRPYYFDPKAVTGHEASMRQNSEGDYVTHEDYAKVEAALREAYQIVHYGRGSMQDVDDVLERAIRGSIT